MFTKQLSILLFACQIILIKSSVIRENNNTAQNGPVKALKSVSLPSGYVAFPEYHAAYKIYENSTTWREARRRCIEENARLAIIDTIDKIELIKSLKDNPILKRLHIGFYQLSDSNEWIKVDSRLPVASLPWRLGNGNRTGNCAGISISSDALVDYGCDWSRENYVCEIQTSDDPDGGTWIEIG